MRLVAISDIHINQFDTAGIDCFRRFSAHPLVREATHIGLMGDIFDLVAGDHKEYEQRWSEVFGVIQKFCEEGKIVYFAEGNHDMHLRRLLRRVASKWKVNSNHLVHIDDYLVVDFLDKKILLSHGDELNAQDVTYLKYKKFVKRPVLSIVADFLMPLRVLDYLGVKASKKSRKYGAARFNEEDVRGKFRAGLSRFKDAQIDVVVGGHSHVEDIYSDQKLTYINNGYPPKSNKFVVIDAGGVRLESLM